jgi:hypothetical protein
VKSLVIVYYGISHQVHPLLVVVLCHLCLSRVALTLLGYEHPASDGLHRKFVHLKEFRPSEGERQAEACAILLMTPLHRLSKRA